MKWTVRIGLLSFGLWVFVAAGVRVPDSSAETPTSAIAPKQAPASDATRAIRGDSVCGDEACDGAETCVSCPKDCGECDPPIIEVLTVDSTNELNPEGTKSCQVVLHLNEPAERLIAVAFADITTSDPDGFFQHLFGNGSTSPICSLIPAFPDLTQDSYVTIGLECSDGNASTTTDPDFSTIEFNNNGHVVGGWFNANPPNGQGDPDAEGNVLIAQFTVHEEDNVCGTATAFVKGDFGLPPVPIECPDFNGNGQVDLFDLALLVGNWGACKAPCMPGDPSQTCPTDLDGDCQTGPADLYILLGMWGPCGPPGEIPPIVRFSISVECPGAIPCFLEVDAITKWSQPPDADQGFSIASDVDLQTLSEQEKGEPGPGPNQVLADDFISDGRPITAVRWWGAYLDPAFGPDGDSEIEGWIINFHADGPPPADPNPADLLSLYFCPADSVAIEPTEIIGSDGFEVYEYATFLEDCCLPHSVADGRDYCNDCNCDFDHNGICDSGDLDMMHGCAGEPDWPDVNCNDVSDPGDCGMFLCLFGGGTQEECSCPFNQTPAGQADGFHEVAAFQYWLDIQAVVGRSFEYPGCPLGDTDSADDHFWGWYTSAQACFDESARSSVLNPPDPGNWQFDEWISDADDQVRVDQAYELLTPVDTCTWDFAGGPLDGPDGKVGAEDLAILLGSWGEYALCEPPFKYKVMDFDANLNVDAFDLAQLLGKWGPCFCFVDSQCPSNDCQNNECVPLP